MKMDSILQLQNYLTQQQQLLNPLSNAITASIRMLEQMQPTIQAIKEYERVNRVFCALTEDAFFSSSALTQIYTRQYVNLLKMPSSVLSDMTLLQRVLQTTNILKAENIDFDIELPEPILE